MAWIEEVAATPSIPAERESEAPGASPGNTHIALFMQDLEGGGIQKSLLRLAESFSQRGHRVDLVVCKVKGPHCTHIPHGVNLVALEPIAFKPAARGLAFACALMADPPGLWALLQPVLLAWKPSPWFQRLPALALSPRIDRANLSLGRCRRRRLQWGGR